MTNPATRLLCGLINASGDNSALLSKLRQFCVIAGDHQILDAAIVDAKTMEKIHGVSPTNREDFHVPRETSWKVSRSERKHADSGE